MGKDSAAAWRADNVLLPHEMDFWATWGCFQAWTFCGFDLAEIGVFVNDDDGVGGVWMEVTFLDRVWIEEISFWIEFLQVFRRGNVWDEHT